MFRVSLVLVAVIMVCVASPSAAVDYPLQVATNQRDIHDAAGNSVFFTADAPWHLVQVPSREEAIQYLDNRQANGFNALLVMLMVPDGYTGTDANYYGDRPFLQTGDFSTPNEDYFTHVDWVLDRAEERGMTVFLTPAYLGYDCGNEGWCADMQSQGVAAMREWGRWVGLRYRNQPNIVWVHGGDADAGAHGVGNLVDAVAEGILEVDPNHLHTAHCSRDNSGVDCYDRPWLDFNTTYADCATTAEKVYIDYERPQTRPFVYIEGRYEYEGSWSPQCMRGQAYASALGGAVGHFFGSRDIWCFSPGWEQSLDSQGTADMDRFDALLRSRDWDNLTPDYAQLVLKNGVGSIDGANYASSAHTIDGNSFIAYVPTQRQLTVDMDAISGSTAEAWWYDPSNGDAIFAGHHPTQGDRTFTSPTADDWVLMVDDVDADLPNVWETATAVTEPSLRVHLAMPTPNPFNPRTTISFTAPAHAQVELTAFDARGRLVETLYRGPGGGSPKSVVWDASDVASGVYFIRLSGAGEVQTQKVALVQ